MKKLLLKKVFIILFMTLSASVFAQTTYVNVPENGFNPSNGWTLCPSKLPTTVSTQSIVCGDGITRDFKYLDCIVNNQFILSRYSKNGGYFEFPEFPSIGEITIYAASTGKDYTLQKYNGTIWNDVAVINVSSAGYATFSFTSGSPVTLRIITKNTGGDVKINSLKIVSIAGDPVPPAMNSSVPANNATDVSPKIKSIVVTFDKNIMAGTGDITITDGESPQIISISSCTINNDQLSIPISGLTVSKTYTVTIPAGAVKNQSGTATTSDIVFNFTTKASLSSEAEILSINFGSRQIGDAVINSGEAIINVTVMYGTSIKPSTTVAAITTPSIIVSPDAEITALPTDFSVSSNIEVTAEDGNTVKVWTVNFIQANLIPATLPVTFIGSGTSSWKNSTEKGFASNIINTTSSQKINNVNWYPAQLSQANQFILVHYEGEANLLSFRIRYGQPNRAYEFRVQESANGNDWTDLAVYSYDRTYDNIEDPDPDVPNSSITLGMRSYPLSITSRYVRWIYTDRTATTMYLDDIRIENLVDNEEPQINNASNTNSAISLEFNEPVKVNSFHTGIILNGGIFSNEEINENEVMCTRDGNVVITISGLTTTD